MLKKALIAFLGLSLLLGAVYFAGLEESGPTILPLKQAAPDRRSAKPVWVPNKDFNGTTPGQTEVFRVPRGPWRLRWEVDGNRNSASLSLTVLSEDQVQQPIAKKTDLGARSFGDIIIPEAGTFYILVSSFEANWRLTIDLPK